MEQEQIIFTNPRLFCKWHKCVIKHDTVYRGPHFHNAIEIVYIKSGSILCCIKDETIRIPENHIMVMGSNIIHHLVHDNTVAEIYYLQVDIEKIINLIYPKYSDIPLLFSNGLKQYALFSKGTSFFNTFQNILYELETENPYYETATMGGLIQLASYLQREGIVEDYDKLFKNPSIIKVLPIIMHINKHYSEKVSLDEVSVALYINKYNLCKIFKKSTGITFFQYLNSVRLQNAEKLLTETNKSITQISFECGFSTVQYFNSVFSKNKGYSPSLYRKLHCNNGTI